MWLTWRANTEVMSNLDQARLDQAALSETIEVRVTALEAALNQLSAQVLAVQADQQTAAPEPAGE